MVIDKAVGVGGDDHDDRDGGASEEQGCCCGQSDIRLYKCCFLSLTGFDITSKSGNGNRLRLFPN